MPRLGVGFHQQSSESYCGAAVAQMILGFLRPAQPLPGQTDLFSRAAAVKKVLNGGVAPQGLVEVLNEGLGAVEYEAVQATTKNPGRELVSVVATRSSNPAAIHWNGGHWVVVDGGEGPAGKMSLLHIIDPSWLKPQAVAKETTAVASQIGDVPAFGGAFCVVAKTAINVAAVFDQQTSLVDFGKGQGKSVVDYLLNEFRPELMLGAITGSRIKEVVALVPVADLAAKEEYWIAEVRDDLGLGYRLVVTRQGVVSVGPSLGAEALMEGSGLWLWRASNASWDRSLPFRVLPDGPTGGELLRSDGQRFDLAKAVSPGSLF